VSAEILLNRTDQFIFIREVTSLVFGKHQLSINHNIEHATFSCNQLRINAKSGLELCSQTDRGGSIISRPAIGNDDIHNKHRFRLGKTYFTTPAIDLHTRTGSLQYQHRCACDKLVSSGSEPRR